MATIPEPTPTPMPTPEPAPPPESNPEIPVPNPGDHPAREEPIAPEMAPETVNPSQEDEAGQSQTLADAASRGGDDFGLDDSDKVPSEGAEDDVQDLVDHMHQMVRSGHIDMDAYRGERNDDDESGDGLFGPAGDED